MLPPATPVSQPQLPPQQQTTAAKSNEVVDAELDSLRKQLDQL